MGIFPLSDPKSGIFIHKGTPKIPLFENKICAKIQ